MSKDVTVQVICSDDKVVKVELEAMKQSCVFRHKFDSLCAAGRGTDDMKFPLKKVKAESMEIVAKWCHHHIGVQEPIIQEKPGTDERIWFEFTEWEADFFKSLEIQEVIEAANVSHVLGLRHFYLYCCQDLASRMRAVNLDPEKIREMFGLPDDLTEEEKLEIQNMTVTGQLKHHIEMKNSPRVIKNSERTVHASFKIEVDENGLQQSMGTTLMNASTASLNGGISHGVSGRCECTDCKLLFDRRPKRFNANAARTFECRERLKRILKKRQAEKDYNSSDDESSFSDCGEGSEECESEISKNNESMMTHKFSELSVEELVEFVNQGSPSIKQEHQCVQKAPKKSKKSKRTRRRKRKISQFSPKRKNATGNAKSSTNKEPKGMAKNNSKLERTHSTILEKEHRGAHLFSNKAANAMELKNMKRARPISFSNGQTKIQCSNSSAPNGHPSNAPNKESEYPTKMQNVKQMPTCNSTKKSFSALQIRQKESNGFDDKSDSTKRRSCSSDAANLRTSARPSKWILVTGPRKTSRTGAQRSRLPSFKSNTAEKDKRSRKSSQSKSSTIFAGNNTPPHCSAFPIVTLTKAKKGQRNSGEHRRESNCNTKNIPSLLDIKVDETLIAMNAKRHSFPFAQSTPNEPYSNVQINEPRSSAEDPSVERKRRQLEKMCEASCKYGAIGQERQKRMEVLTGKRRQEIDVLFSYETTCERDSNPPYFQFMRELKNRNQQKPAEEKPREQNCKFGAIGQERSHKRFNQSDGDCDMDHQQFSSDFPALGSTIVSEEVPCRSQFGYSAHF